MWQATAVDGERNRQSSEACIVAKAGLLNQEIELLANMQDPTITTTEKEKLEAELLDIESKIESKQNEIDLIRAVSSEKICAATASSTKSSNLVPPPKPIMGGLINTRDREEAWTGGKPNYSWTGLDAKASQIPIATQLCSNNSRAAVAMIKQT